MAKKQKIFWAILIGGLFLLCLIPRVLLALGIPLPRLGPAPHQALKCRNRLTGESITIPLEPIDVDYAGGQNTYFTTDLSLGQMEEQMAADASLSYLTDEFTAIDPEQSFHWNADGDLVLVFDEYAVAAGYMGMVEFTIPQDVYSALLK